MLEKQTPSKLWLKSVLNQTRQTIDDYFRTLSANRMMLKPVDFYQLLQNILSHHFLYEYNSDQQTFFQKTNSFQSFLTIAAKFINSRNREPSSKGQDGQFIRREEVEKFIEYWSFENPDLVLLPSERDNTEATSMQTQQIPLLSVATQTDQPKMALIDFINASIAEFSKLSDQCSGDESRNMQIICACLRKQKIRLLSHKQAGQHDTPEGLSPIRKMDDLMVNNPPKAAQNSKSKAQNPPNRLQNLHKYPKSSPHQPTTFQLQP